MARASKKGRIFMIEYAILLLPILIWNYLLFAQVGSQSISNIVEVYIVSLTLVAYSLVRFMKSDLQLGHIVFFMVFLLAEPLVLRLLFPVLPE